MQKLGLGHLHPAMDRELDKLQQLTLDEQMALLEKAKAGDIEARNRFVDSILPLVRYLMNKYYRGHDIEDSVQDMALNMLSACLLYDQTKGSVPTYVRACLWHMLHEQRVYNSRPRRGGDTFHLEPDAMDAYVQPEIPDFCADDLKRRLLAAIEAMESAKIPSVGAKARARAGRVLRLLYGLDGGFEMTDAEVAGVFGCTRQMVSLDKQFGLACLRKMPQVKALLVYLRED